MSRITGIPDGTLCDFCGLPPLYRFPTRKFSMIIMGEPYRDCEGWDACGRFASMVESRDWDGLVTRGVDFYHRRMGGRKHADLYPILHQLYQMFDANRIGPKELLYVGSSGDST